ncbi:MAG: EamA family transporter [Oscillospiraceae bacterium]|nr:EamA family transporter [Oscillospiraceae bacterium]
MSWVFYAVLSAVFAALTSVLAKIGIENVNSNLATAIRTVFVLVMAWGVVFLTGKQQGITDIGTKSWVFLGLSGIATGLSWLCYYKALQLGDASKVIPVDKLSVVIAVVLAIVILHEKLDWKTVLGGSLITAGTLVMVIGK